MFTSGDLPCDWIDFTDDGRAAFLKGTEPGSIVGPEISGLEHE